MKKYSFLIILLYFILLIKLSNYAKLKDNKFLNANNIENNNGNLFNKTMNSINETMIKGDKKVEETFNLDKAVML